jgi:glucan phosphoethanolaminetransferase (alkaline phosphatase superfamily)
MATIDSRVGRSEAGTSSLAVPRAAQALPRLVLDAALWYSIPAAFLWAYVGHYAKPAAAIAPHLRLVALPFVALLLIRLILGRLVVGHSSLVARLARGLVTLTAATSLALLITYYALVLVGLASWGGVVAWNVIPTFFAQVAVVADALHLSPMIPPAAAGLIYIGIVVCCWLYFARFDWTRDFAPYLPARTFTTLLVGGACVIALESYTFSWGQGTLTAEPVSLTLFPPNAALDLEGYSVNPLTASRMGKIEQAARAAYSPAAGAHRNVIVIVVDALRPDHMGVYGYGRDTTPNLMRISHAHPTLIVTGMHSSCGDTICSLYSLFSSRFPREFSLDPFTLHEALRRNGYRIHVILSGDHTYFHSLKGLYGQVDTFYDGTQAGRYFINDDRLLVDRVGSMPKWDGVPTLFQFHLMSAHILRRNDATPGPFQPAARYALLQGHDTGAIGEPLPTAVNFYDNGVVAADSIVNSLLETLGSKGYLRDALVVITADHGESLGEHGLFHHANSVREELLRIPFVLVAYGYQPRWPAHTGELSSEVDIAPTILTELGVPHPRSWSGQALQQSEKQADFSYFDEQHFAGLIDHRDPGNAWKYWIDTRSGEDHVFDLSTDPHEKHEARTLVAAKQLSDWRARTLAATSLAVGAR